MKCMNLGSSLLLNPNGGSLPVTYPAWLGSHLACGQACARLSRAPVPGQRDQELVSWGIDGAGLAVGAGAGEGTDVGAGEGAGSGGEVVAGGSGIVCGKGAAAGDGINTYSPKWAHDFQFPLRIPAQGERHGNIKPSPSWHPASLLEM